MLVATAVTGPLQTPPLRQEQEQLLRQTPLLCGSCGPAGHCEQEVAVPADINLLAYNAMAKADATFEAPYSRPTLQLARSKEAMAIPCMADELERDIARIDSWQSSFLVDDGDELQASLLGSLGCTSTMAASSDACNTVHQHSSDLPQPLGGQQQGADSPIRAHSLRHTPSTPATRVPVRSNGTPLLQQRLPQQHQTSSVKHTSGSSAMGTPAAPTHPVAMASQPPLLQPGIATPAGVPPVPLRRPGTRPGSWRGCQKSYECDRENRHRGICNHKAAASVMCGPAAAATAAATAAAASSAAVSALQGTETSAGVAQKRRAPAAAPTRNVLPRLTEESADGALEAAYEQQEVAAVSLEGSGLVGAECQDGVDEGLAELERSSEDEGEEGVNWVGPAVQGAVSSAAHMVQADEDAEFNDTEEEGEEEEDDEQPGAFVLSARLHNFSFTTALIQHPAVPQHQPLLLSHPSPAESDVSGVAHMQYESDTATPGGSNGAISQVPPAAQQRQQCMLDAPAFVSTIVTGQQEAGASLNHTLGASTAPTMAIDESSAVVGSAGSGLVRACSDFEVRGGGLVAAVMVPLQHDGAGHADEVEDKPPPAAVMAGPAAKSVARPVSAAKVAAAAAKAAAAAPVRQLTLQERFATFPTSREPWDQHRQRLADAGLMQCTTPEQRAARKARFPGITNDFDANDRGIVSGQQCTACSKQATPVWRAGPHGPKTLCNACGVRWMKAAKRGP